MDALVGWAEHPKDLLAVVMAALACDSKNYLGPEEKKS